MSRDEIPPAPAAHQIAFWWRVTRACYRTANRASHHALGFLLKAAVLAYFIFAVLFLGLRYVVLPNIDRYKPDVEQLATSALGQRVTIDTIYASWKGLRPNLFLGGVRIHDRHGQPGLTLPGVSATFSWWSVLVLDARLHTLEISRPDLDITRNADGSLEVGGMRIDPQAKGGGRGLDWVLEQNEIVVRDGRLTWNDAKRAAPELALEGITFVLRNDWQHHRFALKATPPAAYAAPLDVRADFVHPHFTRNLSDFTRWKGEVYADLRNADLAVWKPYVDYPFSVQQGSGGIRAWLKFDRARVADFTADLRLANVVARLRADLQPLLLTEVSGRVSVSEQFESAFDVQSARPGDNDVVTPTFGANGHAIALTDFSLRTEDGLTLPATTITESYTPARFGKPERTELKAKSLDLHTLAEFIERMPLPAAQLRLLNAFEPRGQLRDFSATWQGTYPNIVSYDVNGEFIGLSLKAQPAYPAWPKTATAPAQAAMPAIPGFENLSGRVAANDRGGKFTLDAQDARLHVGGYFSDPVMDFAKLGMQASWAFEGNDKVLLDVARLDIEHPGLAAHFSGKYRLPLNITPESGLGDIDLTGTIDQGALRQVGRYLPLSTPPDTRAWLVGALQGGTLRDASIRLKGELAHFPFTDKAQGEFRVAGKIDDGQLLYVPSETGRDGKMPLWPLLDKINGSILFDRARLEVTARTAVSYGVNFKDVRAVIPDLAHHDLLLSIDGNASGALNDFLRYTQDSPVAEMIGHITDESRSSGNARLGLKLFLPLNHMADTKVQGSLQFANNELALFADLPLISSLAGRIDFNERGLTLPNVRGQFLGGPLTVSGGSQRDDSIVIKADGQITAAGLRRAYAAPAMQRLADRFSGASRFTTTVSVKKKRTEIVVESGLQGLALDLPAPLNKAAGDSLPLRVELLQQAPEEGMQRDELRVALGANISARYQRQRSNERNAPWRVARGGIGINVPAPQPESGLAAYVNLPSLSLDGWNETVGSILGNGNAGTGAAGDIGIVTQYFEPDAFAARATEMIVANKKFDNVVFGASHAKGVWQVNLDAAQASGYLTWNAAGPNQIAGRAMARLSTLVIPKSAAADVNDFLEGKNGATQIPGLDIVADNFELFGKKFGRLELVANNVAASAVREWRISRLSLSNPDAELSATGNWTSRGGDSTSTLNYNLDIHNAGRLLERLNIPGAVRNGKGNMTGELAWRGAPYAFDIPTMSGKFKLDLQNGQILKVETGAARLLSVLSLQSLPRRLTLDFRDIFSDGFAFDAITADSVITQGVSTTDNFKMRGPGGTVLLDGAIDLARESQNLHAAIILDVNAGAASVVYALAVNPLIGVGTMLAQLFLREPLSRAFTFEYQVTGPWQEPVVTKLERKPDPAPAGKANTPNPNTTATPQKAG